MPFTFSHPAIILPLRHLPKSWFSITALVIGSLTPDFEYFIRMKVKSNFSHTLTGVVWFDLPLAILLAFIFHNLIRHTLLENAPLFIKQRVLHLDTFNWNFYFKNNWMIVLSSSLIGILSHIFWDAFTHNQGYFVTHIDYLKTTISLFGAITPIWKIAQHGSTLIGALIILFAFNKLPQQFELKASIDKNYWISVFLLTLFILFIRFISNINALNIGNFIVTVVGALFLSASAIPLIIKFKSNREKTKKSSTFTSSK